MRETTAVVRYARQFKAFVLRRPARTVLACAAFAFGLAAMSGIQPPSVHDEFSYVLAGDTFAHGRLTNPTHPMWRHFETFHVIQEPTYASKYPPAQGLAIALGQRFTGSPGVGIWISFALMIAALTWMLQAWVPPRWALGGGIAASIWLIGKHAFDGYWASTFWGGSMAAMGGALVLGGVRRLARAPTVGASLAVGVGLSLLANSRPFEGLLFVLVPMLVVGWLVLAHVRRKRWRVALTSFGPMLAVLVMTAAMMGIYNKAVTGSATEFPYQRYYNTYDSSPTLVGQRAPALPEYRVAELKVFYTEGAGHSRPLERWQDVPGRLWSSSAAVRAFYAPVFALPLLLVLPWVVRGAWKRMVVATLVFTAIALSLTLYESMPHYVAPALGAIAILYVNSARFFGQLHRRGIRFGRTVVTMVFAAIVLSAILQVTTGKLPMNRLSWRWERDRMQQRLAADGRHFVLVDYGPRHHTNAEWVYNGADIDEAPVVWARSLGAASDSAFAQYYADRTGWRLHVDLDEGPFELVPLTNPVRPE